MRHKGFTLVEGLVVMMILALIGGAIMAFYPASAKLFQRGGAESAAESACVRAVKEMAPIVREAKGLEVVVRDAASGEVRLEVTLPLKEYDATADAELVVYPLTDGKQVAFYRSDDSGGVDTTGEFFWLAEKVSGSWQPSEVLAEGITSFTAPTVQTLPPEGCEVLVSSRATQGSREAQATHHQYLMCRNSQP